MSKRRASAAGVGDAALLKEKSEKKNDEKKAKTTDDIETSVEATPKKVKKEKKEKKENTKKAEKTDDNKEVKKEKKKKVDDKKADEKKSDAKKADDKKADEKKSDAKKSGEKKTDDKKAEDKKVDDKKDEKKKKKKKGDAGEPEKKKKKKSTKSDDSAEVPTSAALALETSEAISHHLTAIASPLATKQDSIRKLHQLIGLAAQEKTCFVRGLKHVAKQLRKGAKGLCILAGNVSPVDVISHFPSFCQEKEVPYVFLRTKEEIGAAAGVKRSITVALITNDLKNDKAKDLLATIIKERNKAQPMKNDALKKEF